MTPRNIRRAAEHSARKEAAKAARHATLMPANLAPDFEPAPPAAQLAANRANALFSCGPRTELGKATVSLNAVKTGPISSSTS